MSGQLKPCPCGKTPRQLFVTADNDKPKYAFCYGDCCGGWQIEFRNDWKEIGTIESNQKAADAWNSAPRAIQPAAVAVPDEVMRALDRMCTPLDPSLLKGATAEADAHSMKVIRDYVLSTQQQGGA